MIAWKDQAIIIFYSTFIWNLTQNYKGWLHAWKYESIMMFCACSQLIYGLVWLSVRHLHLNHFPWNHEKRPPLVVKSNVCIMVFTLLSIKLSKLLRENLYPPSMANASAPVCIPKTNHSKTECPLFCWERFCILVLLRKILYHIWIIITFKCISQEVMCRILYKNIVNLKYIPYRYKNICTGDVMSSCHNLKVFWVYLVLVVATSHGRQKIGPPLFMVTNVIGPPQFFYQARSVKLGKD